MNFTLRTPLSRTFAAVLATVMAVAGIVVTEYPAHAKVNTTLVEGKGKAAALFNPLDPIRIDMTIPVDTWDFIQNDIYTTTYKRAFLKFTKGGKVIKNPFNVSNPDEWEVGIRLKGRASRRDLTQKAPFKIKMDKFVDGQTLFGLEKLTLNNMVQDPSMVRETLIYRLYRNQGVPAPRTGFATVFVTSPGQVTNEYFGLYLNIETPDDVMLKRWFGDRTQHLYESAYDTDVTNDYYHQYLDGIDVGSEDDVTDLTSFLPISELTGEDWWDAVRERADMDEILALMSVDIFSSNWDGYTDFVRNNHYAHFDTDDTLRIMPWGNDQAYSSDPAFMFAFDGSNPDPRGWSGVRSIMYRRCVTVPECNYELMVAIDSAASATSSLKLGAQVRSLVAAVGDDARSDVRKETDNGGFEWQADFVRDYQADRIAEWNEWKQRLIPSRPEVELECFGRRCTFDVAQPEGSDAWVEKTVLQQYVGRKWRNVKTTALDSFVVTVNSNLFRVRATNHFGQSSWASVNNF